VVEKLTNELVALERQALDLWIDGNPDGFLDLSAPDVTYFDPFLRRRLNGLDELRSHYEGLRGTISADSYEIIDPRVVCCGDIAVLSFNFEAHGGNDVWPWNCTESFRRTAGQWRLIQTHWSVTGAALAS
jgi:hypothetical protein